MAPTTAAEPQDAPRTPHATGAPERLRATHKQDVAELVAEFAARKRELIALKNGEPV